MTCFEDRVQDAYLTSRMAFLFAALCAFAVANVYMMQPLLNQIAATFVEKTGKMGIVITATQLGYALGLLLLVPLGDRLNRKYLVVAMLMASVVFLVLAAMTTSLYGLSGTLALVGLMAVVVQIIVAFAAALAHPDKRGQTTGMVTSGIVLGILLARLISGVLTEWLDWRRTLLVSAGAMFIMAVIFLCAAPQDRKPRPAQTYRQLLFSVITLWRQLPELRSRGILAMLIFMNFSVLWSSLVFPLSQRPYNLSTAHIGLFGLAGIAGALAARRAGILADRGLGQRVTGAALVLLLLSWAAIFWGGTSLLALTVGIVMLDFAVQAVHVTSQTLIFARNPQATSRLVAAYMFFYSIGSACGALLATQLWSHYGWPGVCSLGAVLSALALLYWYRVDRNQCSAAVAG